MKKYYFNGDAYDSEKKILDATIGFEKFKEYYAKGNLTEDEFNFLYKFKNNVKHTVFTKREFKTIVDEYFDEVEIEYPQKALRYQYIFNIFKCIK